MAAIEEKRVELKGDIGATDEFKKGQKFIDSLGDWNAFFKSMGRNVLTILVIAYVGSTVVSITHLPWKTIDDLFPTDINNFPYSVPEGKTDPPAATVEEIMHGYDPNNIESLTRGVVEYIFPLKRRSFPYKSWFLSDAFRGTRGYIIAKWFSMTCANAFCAWRKFYVMLILLGQWMHKMLGVIADLFLFYLYPYIIFYVIMLPIIPLIGTFLAFAGSAIYNVPMSWIFTFAPVMGFLLAIANLFSGGIFNIFSWVMSFLIGMGGFMLGYINLAWWYMIGVAMWIYSIVFLFLAPLLYEKGLSRIFYEIKRHTKTLLALFLFLMVNAAFQTLSQKLSIGILVGAIICLILVIKMKINAVPP
jgi:hypothetical protein